MSQPSHHPEQTPPSAESRDRRRLLLRGLRAGGLVVTAGSAVATPLLSIPSTTPDPNVRYVTSLTGGHLCTVSGAQSGVLSGGTGLTTCAGYAPSAFLAGAPLYPRVPAGFDITANKFKQLFAAASRSQGNKTLLEILGEGSNDSIWAAAYLNAAIGDNGTVRFPLGTASVSAHYGDAAYLTFFKTYLVTMG